MKVFQIPSVVVFGSLVFLVGCSSPPVHSEGSPLGQVPSEGTPDFVLRSRSPLKQPEWVEDFESFRRSQDGRGLNYFKGESGDVNDRVAGCGLAELSAKRRISERIAQLVMSRTGSARSGALLTNKDSAGSGELGSDFQDLVATESLAFLSGVQEYGQYWEERDYTPSGGRKRVYLCEALVTIDDAHLKEAIRRTGHRVAHSVSDPVAHGLVTSAFEKLDRGFEKKPQIDAGPSRETAGSVDEE